MKNDKNKINEPRVNDEIRGFKNVRLIYTPREGDIRLNEGFNKVVSWYEAKQIAKEKELDLIEINGNVEPAIVRLDNYSKYLFELKKKLKEQKKTAVSLKEVQLSTTISDHDLETKAKKAMEFIKDGHKVKVVLTFRGRENYRKDELKSSIYHFIVLMEDVAVPESLPKDEGNKCIVILKKKK